MTQVIQLISFRFLSLTLRTFHTQAMSMSWVDGYFELTMHQKTMVQ